MYTVDKRFSFNDYVRTFKLCLVVSSSDRVATFWKSAVSVTIAWVMKIYLGLAVSVTIDRVRKIYLGLVVSMTIA